MRAAADKAALAQTAGSAPTLAATAVAAVGNAGGGARAIQLALVTLAAAGAVWGRFSLGALQETMRSALGLTDNAVALLMGPALALPMLLAVLPIGLAIDRYSRVRLLLAFAVLNVLGCALTILASGFATLAAGRACVGLAAIATAIAVPSIAADLYGPAARGRANMVLGVGQVFSSSAVFALGGAFLAMAAPDPQAWRWALIWLTTPLVLLLVLLLGLREPSRVARSEVRRRLSPVQSCRALWGHRRVVVPLVAGVAMMDVAIGAGVTWTAPTLARNFDLAPERVGAIMAIVLLISGVVGPLLGGLLADLCQRSRGPHRTIYALGALACISTLAGLFGAIPTLALALLALTIFKTINIAIGVTATTLATVLVPNELRGLCISVLYSAGIIFALGVGAGDGEPVVFFNGWRSHARPRSRNRMCLHRRPWRHNLSDRRQVFSPATGCLTQTATNRARNV